MKRLLVIADTHCGHRAGLCPPEHWEPLTTRAGAIQRELWPHYETWLKLYGKPDVLICNGDMIDGKGQGSGGTEQTTTDRKAQTDIATACLKLWKAKETHLIQGTKFHTGKDEDWEDVIATNLKCKIHDMLFLTLEGITFHFKHFVGASSIPHGRHTAGARSKLWLDQWHIHENWPLAHVVVRSHVHYHAYEGGPGWLAMTTPACCGAASKYGARTCEGIVHFGITHFDIEDGKILDWAADVVKIRTTRPDIVKAGE